MWCGKLAETLKQKKKYFRERPRKAESIIDLVNNNIHYLFINNDIDTIEI